ncbi:MAG TPA: cyclic nucleotide-binding domain-containing protein, partial [Gemmataceae bacterium]|nr:cyclic nucleotide-binding domain-containing protein [Gemmataceae bacterium]
MQILSATRGSRIPPAIAFQAKGLTPSASETQGTRRFFRQGDEIFAEGEPYTAFYKVVSGTVRVGKLLIDGRRQIDAFHFPGDVFGLESSDRHRFTSEAVDDVEVIAYRRS